MELMPVVDLAPYRGVVYSAVVSDCCDKAGLRTSSSSEALLPIGPREVVLGWARTAVVAGVDGFPERPYEHEISYFDSLRAGDVAVVECLTDAAAFLGELFSAAAQARGAVGAVVDGPVRDRRLIEQLGFPVYARGSRPNDSLGRTSIRATGCDATICGLTVAEGALVVADVDGVVCVPAEVAADVLAAAAEKASTENLARDALRAGGTLREAWERFRVL